MADDVGVELGQLLLQAGHGELEPRQLDREAALGLGQSALQGRFLAGWRWGGGVGEVTIGFWWFSGRRFWLVVCVCVFILVCTHTHMCVCVLSLHYICFCKAKVPK